MTDPAASTSLSATARWRIVVLMMVYTGLGHFNREGFSIAGTEIFIAKYGIDKTDMGLVYSAFLLAYTIGMLPCGWLIDRFGSGKVLELFGITVGAFVILTGVLGWITSSPGALLVGLLIVRTLAGACFSPLHPGRAHLVSHAISNRGQATANGMATAGALIGIAVAFPIFGGLLDHLGWQGAFVFNGLTLIGFAVLWRFYARPSLPVHQPHTSGESTTDWASVRMLLQSKNLWLLTLSYAAFGYFQYLFFYWMEYYFESVLLIPTPEARRAACYVMLAQGAGMAIGGLSTDLICKNLGMARGRRTIVLTGMGLAALFALIAVNLTGHWNITVFLAFSMAALGICEGVFWTTATDIGGKARGLSGAFMNTGGNVGGLISPYLTPVMAKYIGWPGSITVACAIAGLGGAVWFLIQSDHDGYATEPATLTG